MNIFRFLSVNRRRIAAGLAVFWRALVVTTVVLASPGGLVIAPTEVAPDSGVPIAPGFKFELESPPNTLKDVPTWTELEQYLNNPYALQYNPNVEGELVSGFPGYTTTFERRRSFLMWDGNELIGGCDYNPYDAVPDCNYQLDDFVTHPLNYNPMNGEELRLLNPNYEGGPFALPTELVQCGPAEGVPEFCHEEVNQVAPLPEVSSPADDPNRWVWDYEDVVVTPGDDRVESTSLDFNSPMGPDVETEYTEYPAKFGGPLVCIITAELVPPEGSVICGGDPGEPEYAGFGVYDAEGYSTPAIRGVPSPNTPVFDWGVGQHRLFDPGGCAERNAEQPGSCVAPGWIRRLLRPTVRPSPTAQPNYLQNSMANLAVNGEDSLTSSNENDYYRGNNLQEKLEARDYASMLGKALFWDMQVGSDGVLACGTCHFAAGADDRTLNQVNPNHAGIPADLTFQVAQPNQELEATDFPFNPGGDVVGTNDVASSMGVFFGVFGDIPAINTWVTANGVRALPRDLRSTTANNVDPIPGFQGLRRVEPRNTPTLINSALNFDNFWDGRARHDFNGGSVFGASDPQGHVFVNSGGQLVQTRQIIRNVSLASLATGPGLSEFEMSHLGRNWAKIGKKLLQGTTSSTLADNVTPLANQLVDPNDSLLGPFSNQGGVACTATFIPAVERSGSWLTNTNPGLAPGKPGLCISYSGLIRRAFYPTLWQNTTWHLNGTATVPGPGHDPFDGYVLSIASGPAATSNTNQFTQMEGNFALFWGLSIHAWGTMLISDNAPFDRFFELNPDAFKSTGEANEPGLVWDLPGCDQNGNVQPCFTESGPFKRDAGVTLNTEGGPTISTGTRQAGDPDPLLGMDFFYGFNLSGKNPEFRTARCGECHAGGETTDHTMSTSNQLGFGDFVAEFVTPGLEIAIEPLGRGRLISGFSLEGELGENAQDAIERRIINQYELQLDGNINLSFPDGAAFFDNGMYNIGVTPCEADFAGNTTNCHDVARGGLDPFGWPLSLGRLMLMNLGGPGQVAGTPLADFEPDEEAVNSLTGEEGGPTGGYFEETAQDQSINPGHEEEPVAPQLPPYLAPFASNVPVGDESQQDEAGGGGAGMVNTVQAVPLLEGLVDTIGPFNPAGTIGETYNNSPELLMGTWAGGTFDQSESACANDPTASGCVNRVGFMGSFKAPGLRNVELTAPYFHNGGKLTLAQVIDFYEDGGDFAATNFNHRDFNIVDLREDGQSLGGLDTPTQDEFLIALVDFLLTLTDERVRNEQAPFDHPEIFVPLDGTAPENTFGRPGFLSRLSGTCPGGTAACFRQIPAVGAAGSPVPVIGFPLVEVGDRNNPNCSASAGPVSHYCTAISP